MQIKTILNRVQDADAGELKEAVVNATLLHETFADNFCFICLTKQPCVVNRALEMILDGNSHLCGD
jgi:uncharacterized protein YcaQ